MNDTRETAGPLAVATAVVGMLAGIVAAIYVLGGLVISLRLLVYGFELGSVAAIIGQLPRELVVTTALLDVGLPAAIVGLVGIAVAEVARELKKMPTDHPNNPREVAAMAVVSLVLILPGAWLILDDGLVTALVVIFGFGFTVLATCIACRGVKSFGGRRPPVRLGAIGGFCALAAIVPVVLLAGGLGFEEARACTADGQRPENGDLIGEGAGQLLLGKKLDGKERVLSIASDQVTRTEYGDLPPAVACPSHSE